MKEVSILNIDDSGFLWSSVEGLALEDSDMYNSKGQPISHSFYGYQISHLTNLDTNKMDQSIHVYNLLDNRPFVSSIEGVEIDYIYLDYQIYDKGVYRPLEGEPFSNSIDYFVGLDVCSSYGPYFRP